MIVFNLLYLKFESRCIANFLLGGPITLPPPQVQRMTEISARPHPSGAFTVALKYKEFEAPTGIPICHGCHSRGSINTATVTEWCNHKVSSCYNEICKYEDGRDQLWYVCDSCLGSDDYGICCSRKYYTPQPYRKLERPFRVEQDFQMKRHGWLPAFPS